MSKKRTAEIVQDTGVLNATITQIDVCLTEDGERVACTGHDDDPDSQWFVSFPRTLAASPEGFDADEIDAWSAEQYRQLAWCIFVIHQALEA